MLSVDHVVKKDGVIGLGGPPAPSLVWAAFPTEPKLNTAPNKLSVKNVLVELLVSEFGLVFKQKSKHVSDNIPVLFLELFFVI